MPKKNPTFPIWLQSLSLCGIAIWWVFFISWQTGFVRLMQLIAYRFEPPTVSAQVVASATDRAMEYVTKGPASIQADIFFSKGEVSHLADVSGIFKAVRLATGLAALAGWAILILVLWRLNRFSRHVFVVASRLMIVVSIILLAALLIFPIFFIFFHQLFFPQGNWIFPDTAMLIQLFPETFWKLMVGWLLSGALLFALLFRMIALNVLQDENS